MRSLHGWTYCGWLGVDAARGVDPHVVHVAREGSGEEGFKVINEVCNGIFLIGCIEGNDYDAPNLLLPCFGTAWVEVGKGS